jgi:hypothetical protein
MTCANAITWAQHILHDNGYSLHQSTPKCIQNTAWSSVYHFDTDNGAFFLKIVPLALSLEANIITMLQNEFSAPVPQLIASKPENYCFLMKDAGIRLYDYSKDKFQTDCLTQTLHSYITLQLAASEKVNMFFNHGVPDWRCEKLSALYQALISQENLLLEDGLTQDELTRLQQLTPKLSTICKKLSDYEIQDTFGHADFHDKNILIDVTTGKTTLIDFGEVVITHPFFSLLNCLYRVKENFSLSNEQYQQLQVHSLKPWFALETEENVFAILTLVQQCWSIHAVLGELRSLNSVAHSDFETLHRQGRLAKNLRVWLNQ